MVKKEDEELPEELPEQEWLARRKQGIGGTDISAIVGLNPWRDPWTVYAEKVGLVEPAPPTLAMRIGTQMEPVALDEYERQTGKTVIRLGRRLFRDPANPIHQGTPDGLVPSGPGVEAKYVGPWMRQQWGIEDGSDAVPDWYRIQVEWYMPLTHRDVFDFATLFGNEFHPYRVTIEPELVGALDEAATRFWRDHVLAQNPPPYGPSLAAEQYIKLMYPRDVLAPRMATADEEQALMALWQARESAKRAAEFEAAIENQVKAMIGEAAGIESDKFRVLWKRTKDGTKTDWKAIAEELGVTEEMVEAFSEPKPGVRRFTFNEK